MGQDTASSYSDWSGGMYRGSAGGNEDLARVSSKGLEHFSSFCHALDGLIIFSSSPFNPKSIYNQTKEQSNQRAVYSLSPETESTTSDFFLLKMSEHFRNRNSMEATAALTHKEHIKEQL